MFDCQNVPNNRDFIINHKDFIETLYRQMHGHFGVNKYKGVFKEEQYVIFVRKPVDRIVSHYFYWKEKPSRAAQPYRGYMKDGIDIVDFSRLDPIRKLQTRYVNNIEIEEHPFIGIERTFDKACERC